MRFLGNGILLIRVATSKLLCQAAQVLAHFITRFLTNVQEPAFVWMGLCNMQISFTSVIVLKFIVSGLWYVLSKDVLNAEMNRARG